MNGLSFSQPNLVNPEPFQLSFNNVFTNNMVKYDADREITYIYENLQTV